MLRAPKGSLSRRLVLQAVFPPARRRVLWKGERGKMNDYDLIPAGNEKEWAKSQVLRERELYKRDLVNLAAKLYPHVTSLQTETHAEAAIRVAAAMIAKAAGLSEMFFPMPPELAEPAKPKLEVVP